MSGAKKLTDINKNEYASRNLIKKLLKCSIIVWHSDSRNKWYESPYNFLSLSLILVAIEKLIQVKSKFINLSLNPWNDVFWLMLDVLASTPNNFIDNFYRSNEKWGKKVFSRLTNTNFTNVCEALREPLGHRISFTLSFVHDSRSHDFDRCHYSSTRL